MSENEVSYETAAERLSSKGWDVRRTPTLP